MSPYPNLSHRDNMANYLHESGNIGAAYNVHYCDPYTPPPPPPDPTLDDDREDDDLVDREDDQ